MGKKTERVICKTNEEFWEEVSKVWDYEKNEKHWSEYTRGSKSKIWVKCDKTDYHESYDIICYNYSSGRRCPYCNPKSGKVHPLDSFAQYHIDNMDKDFLNKYWDYEKNNKLNISPWRLSRNSDKKVWIKCQVKDYHGSYEIRCSSFTLGVRCDYCGNCKVHPLDSLGALYPQVFNIWSDENIKSPYEYTPNSGQEVWWKCENGIHEDYYRNIDNSNRSNFCCPNCSIVENFRGENNPNWKGGISDVHEFLRHKIKQWKQDSFKKYNYKCDITGSTKNKIIHHLYGFDKILQETMETLNLPVYKEINKYTSDELKVIENKCLEIHYKYGLGVCLCDEEHKQFHSIYGYGDNTPEQFEEFKKMRLAQLNK